MVHPSTESSDFTMSENLMQALWGHACSMDWLANQLAQLIDEDPATVKRQALQYSLRRQEQISPDEMRDLLASNLKALQEAVSAHQLTKKRQAL
jgi:hypothetical protein